jgi:hypothetical protein
MKLKKYLKAFIKIIPYLIGALAIGFVNISVYELLFGGFPYPILKFSFHCLVVWFFLISIATYLSKKVVHFLEIRYFDFVMIICGSFGILGFAEIQMNQRVNNLKYSTDRYEYWKESVTNSINSMKTTISSGYANYDENYFKISFEQLNIHANKADSLMLDENIKRLENYIVELGKLDASTNNDIISLKSDLNKFIESKIEIESAKKEFKIEKSKDYDSIYWMMFLSAIIMGFFKISITLIQDIEEEPDTIKRS